MLHKINAPQFYTDLGLQTLLNPPVNGKIQVLFKVFEYFSSTFQGTLIFKDFSRQSCIFSIFKYFLFKPVQTLKQKSTDPCSATSLRAKGGGGMKKKMTDHEWSFSELIFF